MRIGLFWVGGLLSVSLLAACESSDNPTAPSGNPNEVRVVANNRSQSFSPNPAQLGGQMVVWRNSHGETHRIMANDGSFDTGNLAPGATSAMVSIPAAGLNYHCTIHPTMVGAIGGSAGEPPPPCSVYCD